MQKTQDNERAIQSLADSLQKAPFHCLRAGQEYLLYESATGLLWIAFSHESMSLEKGRQKIADAQFCGVEDWRLPSQEELTRFVKTSANPICQGQRIYSQWTWIYEKGVMDTEECRPFSGGIGYLICCHAGTHSHRSLIALALDKGWALPQNGLYGGIDRLYAIRKQAAEQQTETQPEPEPASEKLSRQNLRDLEIDYRTCRLPRLEEAQFTDPHKGLWECWGMSQEELDKADIRPRNPGLDVRKGYCVAIDFGTSSTVVAWENNGRPELMRIGVKDFWEKPQPIHYENPTVLEFIDFPAMLHAWQSRPYRPNVLWDQVRCSHEALDNWRNNASDPQVVSSILGRIKQWALRQEKDMRLRITDQKNMEFEHELAPLLERNPVKGQPLNVSTNDPFDPVELYAWFLGMNINWRGRGLFLEYYMTFPVDYPQTVRGKIRAAFHRGLQRSLPQPLVTQQEVFSEFDVQELASEPTAYAAIALPTLKIQPGPDGSVAYAVFDFGGGTADFDYGYYREANPEEEDEGYETVLERCGTAGDKFLGGESLLENMAYQTFRHNLELCRNKKIAFTRPLDAENFAGSEMFLEKTRAAQTNTLMLMARLRPLWESGSLPDASSGVQKIELLNRDGNKVACELAIPEQDLLKYLEERIGSGFHSFLLVLHKYFGDKLPEHVRVHVLLAGNASRSPMVLRLFGLDPDNSNSPFELKPGITVHPPLAPDPSNAYQPTGKTGVALGLLKLCPGNTLKVIDHARHVAGDEAPFAYFVGRIHRGKFQPGLHQGVAYGAWHELGVARERVFNMWCTQSPLVHGDGLEEGHPDLVKHRLRMAGDTPGHKVFARALAPDTIEICTAASREAAQQQVLQNLQTIVLGNKAS